MDYTQLIERLYNSYDAETLCADGAHAIEALQARVLELENNWHSENKCECNTEDACRFARERDDLAAKLAALEGLVKAHVESSNNDDSAGDTFGDLMQYLAANAKERT